MNLDGSSAYVILPSSSTLTSFTNKITIESWVKVNAYLGNVITSGNENEFALAVLDSGRVGVTMTLVNHQANGSFIGNRKVPLGQWCHIAFSYDGTTESIFVNGVLDTSYSTSGNVCTSSYQENITIGGYTWSNYSQHSSFLNGVVEELRVWNVARTASQIQANMNRTVGSSETGLVGYWKFDNNVNDSSPNGNNGTSYGHTQFITSTAPLNILGEVVADANSTLLLHFDEATGQTVSDGSGLGNSGIAVGTTISSGRFGQARQYNGLSDYIRVADNASLRLQRDFTVEVWVRRPSATSNFQPLMVKGTGSVNGWGMFITSDKLHFSSMGLADYVGNTFIKTNEWTHLAAVCGGSSTLSLFVNGVLDKAFTFSTPMIATDSFFIARDKGLSLCFTGIIDEVQISSKARSPQEFNLQLPPSNLNASSNGSSINLSWQNGGGAVGLLRYRIYRGIDSSTVSLIDSTSSTGYLNSSVVFGVKYYYRVASVDLSGFEGAKSYSASAMVVVPPPPALVAIVSPKNVAKGGECIVEIKIADSLRFANMFGLGFDLNYSNTSYIDFVSADTAGCFLGPNLVYILTFDDPNGKVSVGLSRKAPLPGITGGGTVVRLKFRVLTSAPDNGKCVFSFSTISANDPNGTSISCTTIPDTMTVIPNLNVWPGDTDNNGLANQNDVLPLGLFWGKTGPTRPSASIQWSLQPTVPWTPAAATYADANGDGIVNQSDILPIGLNWGKVHSFYSTEPLMVHPQIVARASAFEIPILRVSGPASVPSTKTFEINVILGDSVHPASGLFGISFVLDYASSRTSIQAMEVTPGSLLGNDVIFFPQIDNNNGSVAIGLTRKSGSSEVTGFGEVTKIKFQVVNNSSSPWFVFTTRNIAANDASGNTVAVQSSSNSVIVSAKEATQIPIGFHLEQNYPNPFNPSTRIAFSIPKTTKIRLSILDALGREVAVLVNGENPPGVYESQWEAGNLASGVYFCRLQAGEFVETKKMILIR
ncbi:MAG: T9SS type A sorting domain-containing protein [Ignavibacteriales bacterium]|nr:T9SS type A sorting domain-containing protein [Ignavibacteriales bacterium]